MIGKSMFSLFKKRKAPTPDELRSQTAIATDAIKSKWIYLNSTVHFRAEIPLSAKIDAFITPIHLFFEKSYPVLAAGPAEVFWLTTFTAILESGTHSKEQINAAIAELRPKYVG
jgi:hypothetical protein